ncbi:MAG: sodium:calcium antiporter [Solirubrobacteraceae bacterium]|nr:sodium:calcium antiporter [Solirubrobacteraceae bacterium]
MPTLALLAIFLGSAAAIWVAGTRLSRTTDSLDGRFGLGQALGGLILLGIATSLPELAITVSAAASGHIEVAIGNLLGGIAIQTVVLAVLDIGVRRNLAPLTSTAGQLVLALEAGSVVVVTSIALLGTLLPRHINAAGLSPASVAIMVAWVAGLYAVRHAQRSPGWKAQAPGAEPGRPLRHHPASPAKAEDPYAKHSTGAVAGLFAACALVTLGAGVAIEEAGSTLAGRAGLSGAVFGATFLAAATSLPELSTGLASVRAGNHALAMSDIFGGNAFMPVLFVLADLVSGRPTLPSAQPTDLWLAALGVLVSAIYAGGVILRPQRNRLRMGLDSRLVLIIYALGIGGLTLLPG